jgi:MFS family permease
MTRSGGRAGMASLSALRHRDFRLFWGGQLVSLIGTWMQSVGQAWLVLELTQSPFHLGLVSALQFIPVLLLSMVGGAVTDRLPKRRIILVTQAIMMVQAFVLAALVGSGQVRYWHVAVLATIYGLGRAIDIPARQAFVTDLVGRPDVPNAVALNSVVFNGARIVGPAVAGLLIARFGVAPAFFLNGISFLAVLAALLAIQTEGRPDPAGRLGLRAGVLGALSYATTTPTITFTLGLMVVVSLLVLNFNVVVPLIAYQVLHEGAHGFGLLMSAVGAGAVIGAVGLTLLRRDRPSVTTLAATAGLLCAGVLVLALVSTFGPAAGVLEHDTAARHPRCPARAGHGPLRAGVRRDDAVRLAADRHGRRALRGPGRLRGERWLRPAGHRHARARRHALQVAESLLGRLI